MDTATIEAPAKTRLPEETLAVVDDAVADAPVVDLGKLKIHRHAETAAKETTSAMTMKSLPLRYVAIAVAVALFAGWKIARPGVNDVDTTVAVTAFASQAYSMLNATGYVVAQRKASVASKATGRLEWLGVDEGTVVKAGDVIARLESSDVDAQFVSAHANVEVAQAQVASATVEMADAERSLKRIRDMEKLVSEVTLDDAKSRLAHANANMASARANLAVMRANEQYAGVAVESTRIRAPFDGVIVERTANVGDVVTALGSAADAKGAVVIMADMSSLEVEADVSESSIADIHVNQPCEIELDAIPDKRFHGVVSRVVPTVDRAKATVMTKIRFTDTDPRILPEMSAKATFLSRDAAEASGPLLAVSPDAVLDRDGQHSVFVLRNAVGSQGGNREKGESTVIEIPVTTGKTLGEVIAVTGDIKPGDVLVRNPSSSLRTGDTVRPRQA